MKSILDLFRSPDIKFFSESDVLIIPDRSISYTELQIFVTGKVHYLLNNGIRKNEIIPIISENSPDLIITVLALWKIGAIPVPLNTKLLDEELNEQIKFLESRVILSSKSYSNISSDLKCIPLSLDESSETKNDIKLKKFSANKTALILFTSGASGKPKAVELSFNNLIQSVLIGNKVLNQTSRDRWLASLPFYHIGGFSIVFRALMFGTSIIIPESLSNKHLVESIINYKPTLASFVSNQIKYFVDDKLIPPKELRTILLGGGFLDKDLILTAIEKGWMIAKVYGSTETSSFVSFMNTEEVKQKPEASGRAVSPHKIFIQENEIVVQSPALMKGYFKSENETSMKLKDDKYYTGDIGYLDNEDYLFVEAKRDDLIISGGENINPAEIENVISTHPSIKEVCVIGLDNIQWGQVVSAIVVLKENSVLSENELKNFLKDKLTSFKIPKKIIFVNHLPKSTLGKIHRGKVKELPELK